MAKLRYLGHSAFYLEGEGLMALIDPFLTGNPQTSAKPSDFTGLNAIFPVVAPAISCTHPTGRLATHNHAGLCPSRATCENLNHTTHRIGAVQTGSRPANDLDPFDLLRRKCIPVI